VQVPFSHKICGVIVGPTLKEAQSQIDFFYSHADLLEIRVDRLQDFDIVKKILEYAKRPTLLTLRNKKHGGHFEGSPSEQEKKICDLAKLNPTFIDIEADLSPKLFQQCKSETKILCSYHHLSETPIDLNGILETMKSHPANLYKIVTFANDSLDAMRMLSFVKKSRDPLIGFCMGPKGSFSRVVAPIVGSAVTFVPAKGQEDSVPGQFSLQELIDRFRIHEISQKTELLGLIGDPIEQSPSRFTHHHLIRERGLDAVYVQIQVFKEHLESFLELAAEIGFKGFSVTIPHKEHVSRIISAPEKAVNTLFLHNQKYISINTDGISAIECIESHISLNSAKIVILGAGGAAIGIGKAAKEQGANVWFLNRDPQKAKKIAQEIGADFAPLDEFAKIAKERYDVLINTIPLMDQCPVSKDDILPNKICFEIISIPKETPFYLAAQEKNCIVIPGMEMFLRQAKKQFDFWYPK